MTDAETLVPIGRLKRRADFLRAAKGRRTHLPAFTLQGAPSGGDGARVGFTLTRKVGGAVIRNRARRRLKEAVRLTPDLPVAAGYDYVIIGRIEALRRPFADLQRDLARAVSGLLKGGSRKAGSGMVGSGLAADTKTNSDQAGAPLAEGFRNPADGPRPKRTRRKP